MKQNDPEMTKAKRVLVGQVALAFAIVAVIVWLWGWEAGITAVAVMAAAFIMLCFSMPVATLGDAHLLAAAILAGITSAFYLLSLLLPFIYGEWFAVSWLISVTPLVCANISRRLERRKVRRHRSEY